MFCRNCGKEIDDKAAICIHCGCKVEREEEANPKKGVGFLCGLLLGLIGLLIGVFMYKENTLERKTFVGGWGIGFIISLIAPILIYLILYSIGSGCYYMTA